MTNHKRIIRTWLFTFVFVSPALASETLRGQINSILTNLPHKGAKVGACVIDLDNGKTVYEFNADSPLVPASAMKVFTMAAAIDILGKDFRFNTNLQTDGTNLLLIADGDPEIVKKDPTVIEAYLGQDEDEDQEVLEMEEE